MADQLHDRAALLRWWRTQNSKLGLDGAARAVGVESPTTVHNWETGRTDGPNLEQLSALDNRFGAGGALRGLYAALRTPDALAAAADWWCNFQGESGPCWAWLRVAEERSALARISAGPFQLDCEVPGGSGVFVQAYAFAHNPAVHVHLDGKGWVDFGYGVLPPDLGATVIDAIEGAVISPRGTIDQALVQAGKSWLPDRKYSGDKGWFNTMKGELGRRVEVARHALSTAAKAIVSTISDVSCSHASRDEVPRHWGGEHYQHLRAARGQSLQDIAELVSRLDPSLPAVTKDHVHRFERGATPRVQQLPERLDTVLGADGRTCAAEVTTIQNTARHVEITFPSYWVGPIWVQFLQIGKVDHDRATLLWSPWHKRLKLRDGVVVTTRRSEPAMLPLSVEVPAGWRVHAGVGVHPRAVDVNEG